MRRIFHAKSYMMPQNKQKKPELIEKQCRYNNNDPVYLDKSGNICIRVNAKPGAKQSAVTSIDSDGVGIQIAAPPLEGEANTELIKFLSKLLDMRKRDLCLDKGARSRNKIVQISKNGTTPEVITELLRKAID